MSNKKKKKAKPYRALVALETDTGWTAAICEYASQEAFEANLGDCEPLRTVVTCGHNHEVNSDRINRCLKRLGNDSRLLRDFQEHARACAYREPCDCGMGHLCEHEKGCEVCDKNECPLWKEVV